jgi:hypothetical protein
MYGEDQGLTGLGCTRSVRFAQLYLRSPSAGQSGQRSLERDDFGLFLVPLQKTTAAEGRTCACQLSTGESRSVSASFEFGWTLSRRFSIGEFSIGEFSIGEFSIGEFSIGELMCLQPILAHSHFHHDWNRHG